MRSIEFRGKRIDDGEWVYGNLFIPDKEETPTQICIGTNVIRIAYDVDPPTVGQYTGLTDKKGKKIFEGDIVHCVSKFDSADMVVIFECGQFRRILAEKYHEYQTNVGYYDINCFAKEVIGNIHDNLELLERG